MTYLDFDVLDALDAREFRGRDPYPWLNPEGCLRGEGHRRLRDELPPVALFRPTFGAARRYGQASHDRYLLSDRPGLELSPAWQEFLAELRGARYRKFVERMLGTRWFALQFEWHYAPSGCSVSPHCDAKWKLGSHIFYFNTAEDWQPSWGGETLILDDRGRFSPQSAPTFAEFDAVVGAESIGNASLLFARRGNSWHGVREIRCPEGSMRKVFIVMLKRSWIAAAIPRPAFLEPKRAHG